MTAQEIAELRQVADEYAHAGFPDGFRNLTKCLNEIERLRGLAKATVDGPTAFARRCAIAALAEAIKE